MTTTTYAEMATAAHLSGGQTQTEACENMSDTCISHGNLGWLSSILASLQQEASACHTERDYARVRTQIERVRTALNAREY